MNAFFPPRPVLKKRALSYVLKEKKKKILKWYLLFSNILLRTVTDPLSAVGVILVLNENPCQYPIHTQFVHSKGNASVLQTHPVNCRCLYFTTKHLIPTQIRQPSTCRVIVPEWRMTSSSFTNSTEQYCNCFFIIITIIFFYIVDSHMTQQTE